MRRKVIPLLFAVALTSFPLLASEIDLSYSESRPMPSYPRQAALDCVEGEVLAGFAVSDSLEPKNIRILRSTPNGIFDQVVLDALDRWLVNAKPGTELERLFEFDLDTAKCQ